jgi:hypothetical protein
MLLTFVLLLKQSVEILGDDFMIPSVDCEIGEVYWSCFFAKSFKITGFFNGEVASSIPQLAKLLSLFL